MFLKIGKEQYLYFFVDLGDKGCKGQLFDFRRKPNCTFLINDIFLIFLNKIKNKNNMKYISILNKDE